MRLKHFISVFLTILTLGVGQMWATATTTTYVFQDKSWKAKIGTTDANWTSGQDGAGFSNNGVQVTTNSTGANATSPTTFNSISKIVVTYNTNASKGAGTLGIKIGTNDEVTQNWAYSTGTGTSANYTLQFDYTTTQSGSVKITAYTTTNSIYVVSIAITYDDGQGGGGSTETDILAEPNNESYGSVAVSGTTITATPESGYRVVAGNGGYTVLDGEATVTNNGDNTFSVSASEDCLIQINFEAILTHKIYFNTNGVATIDYVEVAEGATYSTLPESITGLSENCAYPDFVGWTLATSITDASVKPALVSSVTMGDADVTLYAVYSKTVGGSGESGSVTLTTSTENFPSAYGTANTFTEYTLEGYTFKIQQGYINGTKLQWRASGNNNGTGIIYNTETFPGKISSIVLTYDASDTGKNFTLNVGDAENPTEGTSITPTNVDAVYTFDCSNANADYFVLTNGTGAGYLTSIQINYGSAGSTTYSLAAGCCEPIGAVGGTISWAADGNNLVASGWDVTSDGHETGYLVKLYNSDKSAVIASANTGSKDTKTYTFNNPGAGTYWVSVTPTSSGTYCAEGTETFSVGSVELSGKVVVTFMLNGGTVEGDVAKTQEVDPNTNTALTAIATLGYVAPSCKEFGGWASSAENANAEPAVVAYADAAEINVSGATSLWAIWNTKTFAVTDGTIAASVASHSYLANPITCGADLTVTCAAAEAYKGEPTVTATGTYGTITVVSATEVTIANVQSDIAVSIAYETEKTSYAITWNVNGAAYAPHDADPEKVNGSTSVLEGTAPTLPTAPELECAGTFMGWSRSDLGYTSGQSAPSDLFTDPANANITANTTFYAVFAAQTGGNPASLTFNDATGDSNTDIANKPSDVNGAATASGMSYTSGSKVYEGTYGMKIGASSAAGSMTFTVSPAISTKTIKVDAKKYGTDTGSFSVTVNGETAFGSAQQPSAEGGVLTFTVNDAIEVSSVTVATSSKRGYVKSFSVGEEPSISDYVTQCPAVAAPTITLAAGTYCGEQTTTITAADGATIKYTTDGTTEPSLTAGEEYSGEISITESMTIKAIAVKGEDVSSVAEATYTINTLKKVSFDAGSGTASAASLTEEDCGAGITLPSATPSSYCAAEGWTFAGWATENNTTVAPTIVSGTYVPESDITLYAVYRKGDGKYHLVTTLPTGEDIPGKYMIVYTDGKSALEASTVSGKVYQLWGASIANITENAFADTEISDANYRAKSIWDVTYESNHWIFKNANTNKYLYGYVSGNYHNISIQDDKPIGFDVTLSGGFAVISSADAENVNVFYSTTDTKFEGTDGNTKNIHLYKLIEEYSSAPACCNDEVTVGKADNPENGTFTLDKTGVLSTCTGSQEIMVTCVPSAGYYVNEVTETGASVAPTIEATSTANVYKVTYAKNTTGTSTISVSFSSTPDPSISVSTTSIALGDVLIGSEQNQTFTVEGANLVGATLTLSSSNEDVTLDKTSLSITDGAVEETTITITVNTANAGTVEADITIADGAETPNSITVHVSASVKNQYTVNWYVNGQLQAESATYLDGAAITKPADPESCDASISFMGWTTAAISGKQQSAPNPLIASADITNAEASVDYYAVFAKAGETSWTETALADLTASDIFVIVGNNGNNYAMSNDQGTGNPPTAVAVTIVENQITTAVGANMKWNVSGNATDGYTFYPNGSTTTWLYCTNTNNGVRVGNNTNKTFAIDGGYLKHASTSRYVGVYQSQDWRCYTSSTGTSNIAGQTFAFYKFASSAASDYMTTCSMAYSVTYNAGTGTGNDYVVNDIAKNAPHTILGNNTTNFTKEHYHFTGWKLDDVNYAPEDVIEHVTADLTFVAQWEVNTFTMSYNANEGSVQAGKEALGEDIVNDGDPYTVKENVYEVDGKLFAGWLCGTTTYQAGDEFVPTENMEFVAQWVEPTSCTISFQVNGAEVTTVNAQQGDEYVIPEIANLPEVTGFTFEGWSETEYADETDVLPTMITSYTPAANESSKVLYGIYSRLEVGEEVTDVLTAADLAATSSQYAEFTNVKKVSSAVYAGKTAKNGENIQINEKAKQGIYSIASAGELVSVAITMNSASTKLGVYGSNDGFTGYTNIPSQAGVTLIEEFSSVASKTVTPAVSYKYVGITSSGDGAKQISSISITWLPKATYYTSSPVEKVTVTFALAGGEGGCQTTTINKGGQLTICSEAPTMFHSKFMGWNTQADGEGTAYVVGQEYTFNADITLYAQWAEADKYTVTYAAGGATGDVPEDANEYFAGDQVTVLGQGNLEKSGYDFQGWRNGNKLYAATATFAMPAENVILTAQWRKQNIATTQMSLVKDASMLATGMEVILACKSEGKAAGNFPTGKEYMEPVEATFNGDIISAANPIVFVLEQVEGGWLLMNDGKFLARAGKNAVKLAEQAFVWTIAIGENATIQHGDSIMMYNATSGQERFCQYNKTSSQKAIQLYGKATVVTTTASISDLGYVEDEPIVASGNITLTIDEPTTTPSITAKDGAKVVISEETTTQAVVVEEGSKLVAEAETHTPVVHFSTTLGSANPAGDETTTSELEEVSNIILPEGGEIHWDITWGTSQNGQADPTQWHAFTVPFPVDALNGIYNAETDEKLTNEVDYAIMDYHGDIRANGQYGWKKYQGVLVPGAFYLMTINGDIPTFRFKQVTMGALQEIVSMAYVAYGVTDPENLTADQGWNGIGNPSWSKSKVNYPVQVLDPWTYTYVTRLASAFNFSPCIPFFYKAASDGTMNMLEANADANYAPRRTPANEIKNMAVSFGNEVYADQLYITASEDALNSYENDKDLVKMVMSNTPKVAQIFGSAYGMKLSMVSTPLVNDQAEVALELYAPAAGEYTISVAENENATVYLTRDGSVIWNLSMSAYTADFAKGNNAGYGIIIRKAPNAMTGIEGVEANQTAQKVLLNDHVYILRNEQMYDIDGKVVK